MKIFKSADDIKPCQCWPPALEQVFAMPNEATKYVHYECPSCHRSGTETCKVCLGAGFDGKCPKCHGTGKVVCGYCLGKQVLHYTYPHFGSCTHYTPVKETPVKETANA